MQEVGETPLSGVTVFLDTNDNGVIDNGTFASPNVPLTIPTIGTINSTNPVTASGTISFTSTSLTFSIPFVGIGPGGEANFGILVGTFEEATDRGPNGATPAQTVGRSGVVPEPASVVLLGLGAVGVVGRHRRRAAR